MTKDAARKQMKARRRNLSEAERAKRDSNIFENIRNLSELKKADCFFSFVSHGTEADTLQILQYLLWENRMPVAVPKVSGREMEFYEIQSLEQLKTGSYGILEPVTQKKVTAEKGIMLVPGLAFDRQKHRVGYGGGYYDRYLARHQTDLLVTVAVAYDFQIVGQIEAEDFDMVPDIVLTDRCILR